MINNICLTEIEILPIKPKNGLVAFASCVLNKSFYIGNIVIHTTPYGNFRVVYPTKVLPNGKHISCFHPINREAGEAISSAILERYKNLIMDIEAEKVARLEF
ncbi:septation protein SpoVG family protein [Candidatus Margulisiibacteriota bacterium]